MAHFRDALHIVLLLNLVACPGDDDDGDGESEGSATTSAATTGGDTTGDSTAGTDTSGGGTDGELACGEDWVVKDPAIPSLMLTWGAPCTVDSDCVQVLGFANATCVHDVLGVYTLPQGYCTRPCTLPSIDTLYVPNDPACNPAGGIDCIGAKDNYEACAPPCTQDSQCGRMGYACTLMPLIGAEGDPRYCLMNPMACEIDSHP